MAGKVRTVLEEASAEGLVAPDKIDPLADFLTARGFEFSAGKAESAAASNPDEESEMPRFIRGYHDVLITIGIVVTLIAIGGLWSVWAALVVTIILAEIFVRKQHLALPSFVLTVSCLITGFWGVGSTLSQLGMTGDFSWQRIFLGGDAIAQGAGVFLIVGLFYWRYRVPVAFSGLLTVAVLTLLMIPAEFLFGHQGGQGFYFTMLVGGIILTASAIMFDLKDPERITRRSDVAFWLYLVAVPMILKTFFDLLNPSAGSGSAVAMLIIVFLMMMLGLVLDRRAFVTAGLIYLGFAVGTLLEEGTGGWYSRLGGDGKFLYLLLAVGLIVLVFGIGWRLWRQMIVGRLPEPLLARLPKIR